MVRACVLAALSIAPAGTVAAGTAQAQQQEPVDPPVSFERIREGLAKPAESRFDRPVEGPVARFRTTAVRHMYVPTIEEWIAREFSLTKLQRQSADWASRCCGVDLFQVFDKIEDALRRRAERRAREEVARELAAFEARRNR